MFSLEVYIRNLTPTDNLSNLLHQSLQQTTITIRFGPLQSDILLSSAQIPITSQSGVNNLYSGGKRLILQMQKNEIQNLLSTYAFGLFMQNRCGRFWCVLSLEKVHIGDNYVCDHIVFYNDDRQTCYTFQLGIKLMHHNPRVPKNANLQQNQPIATAPAKNKEKKIKSFLYGKKNSQIIQSLQLPHQVASLNQNQKKQQIHNKKNSMNKKSKVTYTYAVAQYQPVVNNFVGPQSDDQSGIYIPPVMQFINNEYHQQPYKKQSEQNEQSPLHNISTFYNKTKPPQPNSQKQLSKTLPKFQTFVDYSQFRQRNQKSKNTKNFYQLQKQSSQQQKPLTREQLRQLARKEAQAQYKKQKQIMIPVPNAKTGTYQLVPLSSLSEAQILEYAHRQKLAQEYKKNQQQQKRKKKIKEQKKKKRQQHIGKIDKQTLKDIKKQNMGVNNNYKQKISQKNKQSSGSENSKSQKQEPNPPIRQNSKNQVNNNQKQIQDLNKNKNTNTNTKYQNLNEQRSEQSQDSQERDQFHNLNNNNQGQQQEQNYQEDYQSDFQSISNAGSLIKSRKSLQSSISVSQSHQKQKQKIKNNQQHKYNQPQDQQRLAKYNEINDKYQYYLNKNKNASRKSSELDISESMDDYGYSQDFDSFSQSVLSKNKRGSSISEISGDYGYIPSINYGNSNSNRKV